MLVTPFGIVKEKFVADENLVPHFGSAVTAVSPEQPRNAESPMLVTLSGIVIDVNPEQPENAESAIPRTPVRSKLPDSESVYPTTQP